MEHNELWKILKETEKPDHLICLLRNLYGGQEATVRTGYGLIQNWERSTSRLYIVTLLFNFYAVHSMQNAGPEELQAGIKMTRRSINNLKCGDDTSLMKESKEELKSLLMRVKEEGEKAGLKPSIQKLRSWHPVPSIHGK